MVTSSDPHIEHIFPAIKKHGYQITSPSTSSYNCIAWAVGNDLRWWWPDPLMTSYWPHDIPREETITTFIEAFATLGYTKCNDETYEVGYEKIAIYINQQGIPTHAARQLKNGKWTSKLGKLQDIEHNNLEGLAGNEYGIVGVYLRRKCQ